MKLYRERAWLHIARQHYDSAEADFSLAIEENSDVVLNYIELCELYAIKSEPDKIFTMEKTIMNLHPDHGYLTVYVFYKYYGRLLQGKNPSIEESELQKLLA